MVLDEAGLVGEHLLALGALVGLPSSKSCSGHRQARLLGWCRPAAAVSPGFLSGVTSPANPAAEPLCPVRGGLLAPVHPQVCAEFRFAGEAFPTLQAPVGSLGAASSPVDTQGLVLVEGFPAPVTLTRPHSRRGGFKLGVEKQVPLSITLKSPSCKVGIGANIHVARQTHSTRVTCMYLLF